MDGAVMNCGEICPNIQGISQPAPFAGNLAVCPTDRQRIVVRKRTHHGKNLFRCEPPNIVCVSETPEAM